MKSRQFIYAAGSAVGMTVLLALGGSTLLAGPDEFKADVNAAIDAGLVYSRANGHFTTYTAGNGLSLLTLLEKESIPAGYNGLDAGDKVLAQNAACILIDDGNFGDRGGFYSYFDGQVMMGLSVYLETGGPDTPAAPPGYNCVGRSARATIDKVADRSMAAQSAGPPAAGSCAGYWGYASPGCDSSTTQFTLAGLSAARRIAAGPWRAPGRPAARPSRARARRLRCLFRSRSSRSGWRSSARR